MTDHIKTPEELLEEYHAWQEELDKIVRVEDGFIVINVHYKYNIEISRCDTYEKIVGWVLQLSEKTWMTKDVLEHFVKKALQASQLATPHP